jgi:hypothetical protein
MVRSGGSRDHGEAVPVGFDSDEVLDDVQECTAMMMGEAQGCSVMTTGKDRRLGCNGEVQGAVDLVLYWRILGTASLPKGAACQGGHGGEVARAEMHWNASILPPELRLRTVASSRSHSRRSGMQSRTRLCQGDARDKKDGFRAGGMEKGGRGLPPSSSGSCSTGGSASSKGGGLAAGWLGFWEKTKVGTEGVFIATRGRRNRNVITWIRPRRSRSPRAGLSDGG